VLSQQSISEIAQALQPSTICFRFGVDQLGDQLLDRLKDSVTALTGPSRLDSPL